MKNINLNTIAFLILTTTSNILLAQNTTTLPIDATKTESDFNYKDVMGLGIAVGPGTSAGFSYERHISSHFNLGLSYFARGSSSEVNDNKEGNLSDGTYYENKLETKAEMFELNSTFYFRQNGANRWGALIRAGVGYAKREVTLESDRYDNNIGFWGSLFGSDKRLLESNTYTDTWYTMYTRIGPAYQFAWVPAGPSTRPGHILELGLSAFVPTQRETIRYTRNDGSIGKMREDAATGLAEITYKIVF